MKAVLCSQYCQPDDLVLADVPDPVAGSGEAVIAIKAAALNFFDLLMIPDNLDFDRAAGIIIIYGTALHALEDRASLKAGETLAVLGAAGGTGLAACEVGKLMGLKVIACASSDEKLAFARQHGAELTLNYATEDLKEGLRKLTGGKGTDI